MKKLFSKFLNSKPKEENEDNTDAIIDHIENEPLAISPKNVLYGGANELGGFFLLNTVVVGQLKIKTNNGAKLLVKGKDFELELNSDMLELQSDFTNVPKRYITKIDFQMEKEHLGLMEKSKIDRFILKSPKKNIEFEICREARKPLKKSEEEE